MANKRHIIDWFALGCSLFGIWELLRAVESVIFAFNLLNGWYRSNAYTFAGEMLFAIAHIFLGLSLLATATKLAAFWYPDTASDKAPDEDNSDSNTTNV